MPGVTAPECPITPFYVQVDAQPDAERSDRSRIRRVGGACLLRRTPWQVR